MLHWQLLVLASDDSVALPQGTLTSLSQNESAQVTTFRNGHALRWQRYVVVLASLYGLQLELWPSASCSFQIVVFCHRFSRRCNLQLLTASLNTVNGYVGQFSSKHFNLICSLYWNVLFRLVFERQSTGSCWVLTLLPVLQSAVNLSKSLWLKFNNCPTRCDLFSLLIFL